MIDLKKCSVYKQRPVVGTGPEKFHPMKADHVHQLLGNLSQRDDQPSQFRYVLDIIRMYKVYCTH